MTGGQIQVESKRKVKELIERITLNGSIREAHGNTTATYEVEDQIIKINSSFQIPGPHITIFKQNQHGTWEQEWAGTPEQLFDKLPKAFQEELVYAVDLLQ